jgi:hypothetical protein
MQGRSRQDRELWDAGEVAGHLVPAGSVFAFLAEHRRELFPDSFTADLFTSRTGRPSLSADLVGSVLVLRLRRAVLESGQGPLGHWCAVAVTACRSPGESVDVLPSGQGDTDDR